MYLTQGLHRAAQQQPDKVMTVHGARRRTFAQVIQRVARLAGGLRRLGVDDGERVAMLSLNSDCYNEYLLAVPWANAVLAESAAPMDDARRGGGDLAGVFYTGEPQASPKGSCSRTRTWALQRSEHSHRAA
jgi:long-subunit acyl-CoA synthetase (AMP-forming)